MDNDKITLESALSNDVWKIILLSEPNRKIDVEMTYEELLAVCVIINERLNRNDD